MSGQTEEFDYIIVGAGSSGCVLASRLSEDPDVSVLVVEAGGADKSLLFRWPAGFAKLTKGIASWGWSTVPQKHLNDRVLWYTQGKVLGGGSTINALNYTRGHARDYDGWAEDGCDGWSYREILPYFKRAEGNERFHDDYHGTEGPLGVSASRGTLPIADAFVRAAQQYGIPYNPDFNGRQQAGTGYYQLTQRDLKRSSTASAYLHPASQRPNLTVRSGQQVRRIVLQGKRAIGIETNEGGRAHLIRARHEVLVTSGAIGSPRLLLLSGIGPADHLASVGIDVRHDLPGVGQNLQDHLDLCALGECSGRYSYDGYDRFPRSALAALQYVLFKSGPVTSSLFETGAFWFSNDQADRPDVQFHFGQGSGIEKGIVTVDKGGVTLNCAYMRPKSRGSVTLASADPDDAPLIDPNYWSHPQDREGSLNGLEIAREILSQPAFEPFLAREALPGPQVKTREDLFAYACRMAKTQHHPAGTCRMGVGDMAVVDPQLSVHGLEGLRVCDSSIMPTINSSNTNAPTIMIGEKASDLIRALPPLPAALLEHNRGPRLNGA
ncbi:Choline dehydrogenase [Candidatus Rhodobacter oscarellae]|uniref:Choline dehydrogenase n=1 Tax=Candidatus Rhodobacter oscarellae TaxID=1675527 RepID=A0A0J9E995_9RHOB|nr:GMC family oxidoreductase N-terminal domain-containing protein [Candidatus Rhodobacter lobularis]KMW59360.1 Choline dehydrogenase [Candidatus Rhodobacter lobularis]